MNLDFWANKNILITGHTGFKGSWLSVLLNHLDANVYGLSDEKKDGIYEFFLCAPPLVITRGTGSPINPQAIK
mgnify:CR=1 FL=1